MRISEIFNRKTANDAETYVDERVVPSELGVTGCNCERMFGGNIPAEVAAQVAQYPAGSPEKAKPLHRHIVDTIKKATMQGDADTLNQFINDDGDDRSRRLSYLSHLFSHTTRAGSDPREEFGISNADYENYKSDLYAHKNRIEVKQLNTCGTCSQYVGELKNALNDYHNNLVEGKLKSGPFSTEHARSSATSHIAGLRGAWERKETPNNPQEEKIFSIMDNLDKHSSEVHQVDANSENPTRIKIETPEERTPEEKKDDIEAGNPLPRNTKVESVFNRMLGVGRGWSIKRDTSTPKKDPLWDENTQRPVIDRLPGETDEEHEGRWNDYIGNLLRGKVPGFENYAIKPKSSTGTEPEGQEYNVRVNVPRSIPNSRSLTTVELPSGNYQGYTLDDDVVGLPGVMNYYTREKANRTNLQYNPSDDPRPIKIKDPSEIKGTPEITVDALNQGIEARLPRRDRFLFQQAGMLPDLDLVKEHHRAMAAYENRPNQEWEIVGYEERGKDPWYINDTETRVIKPERTVKNEKGEDVTIPAATRDVAVRRPALDENGRPRFRSTERVPVYKSTGEYEERTVKIPEEQRMQRPVLDAVAAHDAYHKSRREALRRLYGADDDVAESSLAADHSRAISEKVAEIIKSPKNRIFISKKGGKMPRYKFNSNNKKQAIIDPNSIDLHSIGGSMWHGLKDVGHMLNTPVNQVRQLINGIGNGGLNDRGFDAGVQLLGEGIATDQILKNKFDTSLKEQVNRPIDALKQKLNDRRTLQQRKQKWDAWPSDLKAKMVGMHGREANPMHPNHDLSKSYSIDGDNNTVVSSKINNLSARLAADKKVCEDCGKLCANKKECNQNVQDRRRQQAADSMYND